MSNNIGLKNGKHRAGFSKTACEIMEKNEKFLIRNYKTVVYEIVELANDAIDHSVLCTNKEAKNKTFGKSAFNFYIRQILLPESHAIFTNLLIGNLPACFRGLRFMTEMIAKCYLADTNHPGDLFFGDKIKKIHTKEAGRIPEIRFIKAFDKKINTGSRTEKLWRKLSDETHGMKFTGRVLDNIIDRDNVPGYSIMIPIPYTKGDIGDLKELSGYIVDFQRVLSKTF